MTRSRRFQTRSVNAAAGASTSEPSKKRQSTQAKTISPPTSCTTARQRPPAPDLNISLIDLEEGPRMMSRIDGIPASEVRIGMAVRARIITENEQTFVVFVPA